MKFDSTVNFALLLTLCSIVLPTITTILNNRHQIKIRKMDFNFDKNSSPSKLTLKRSDVASN